MMIVYYLSPTVLRFVFLKSGAKYGVELCVYMIISRITTLLIYYGVYQYFSFPTLADTIGNYCILSYDTTGGNQTSKTTRIGLTVIIVLSWIVLSSGIQFYTRAKRVPIGALCILIYALNYHSSSNTSSEHNNTENDNEENLAQLYEDSANTLVSVGLARIELKTKRSNKYFTIGSEEARNDIEEPFVEILASNYKTEA